MSPHPQNRQPDAQDVLPSAVRELGGPSGAGDAVRLSANRRDFLKVAGFTLAAAALPSCSRAPTHEAIPYMEGTPEFTPGNAAWYATLCGGCSAGCGILAKVREGRPIKIEGNPEHPLNGRGSGLAGACAVAQATVLSLYDRQRLRGPVAAGAAASWEAVDKAILEKLATLRTAGGGVRVLTGTLSGPTQRAAIESFVAAFPDGKHIMVDGLSASALLDAHDELFGARVLPHMRFDRASVIASFDADFLGTWVSPVEFTRDYTRARNLSEGTPARHFQLESRMSLTGASADERIVLAPAELGGALAHLAVRVAQKAGRPLGFPAAKVTKSLGKALAGIADALWTAPRGTSLVVCGSNHLTDQKLVAQINHMLGNYGASKAETTLDLEAHSNQKLGDDRAVHALVEEINAGKVGALFVAGCNPVYDQPEAKSLAAALKKVGLLVSLSERVDETSAAAGFVCPDHHALESWNDSEPTAGTLTVAQPVIRPLGDTRGMARSFAVWSGQQAPASDRDLMRAAWQKHVAPRGASPAAFERYWNQSVHDGHAASPRLRSRAQATLSVPRLEGLVPSPAAAPLTAGRLAVVLYPTVGMLDGRHAHNPWLHELPDPITKVAWDNYAALAPATAARLGIEDGDVVSLEAGGRTIELPALIQPGQHPDVVAVPLGYGRKGTDRFADIGPSWIESEPTVAEGGTVGVNVSSLLGREEGRIRYAGLAVALRRTGAKKPLARTQIYGSQTVPQHIRPGSDPRPAALSLTLAEYMHEEAGGHATPGHAAQPLWDDDHGYDGNHWGLAIDLSRCTGCSACVIACQAENNIPVVGRDEVRRTREMHWLRIDRYYEGEGEDVSVIHQPMLCQQCDNAPCETVCPVLATMHSDEGLNQQVYNRCVGTRYCSNNCPYKVRRFNWFKYEHADEVENLVLNPDVTVRTRGVMEKCTFCVQRIQEKKIKARNEDRALLDGEIKPACAQSCPADAMVFGNMNDAKSRVSQSIAERRSYRVLEDLDVRPSIHYMARVRQREERNNRDD